MISITHMKPTLQPKTPHFVVPTPSLMPMTPPNPTFKAPISISVMDKRKEDKGTTTMITHATMKRRAKQQSQLTNYEQKPLSISLNYE